MICSRIRCPAMRSEIWVGSSLTNLTHNQNFCTQCIKILKDMSQLTWKVSSDHFYTPADHVRNFLKSHGRTFGKKPKVEVLKQSIQIWGALDCCRHLLWRFFMVLKHMNCLSNVIIENFLKSHGRTKKLKSSLTGVVIDLIWQTFLYESHCLQ